jgi:hypothetical protein
MGPMTVYLILAIVYLIGLAAVLIFFAGASKASEDIDAQNELLLKQVRAAHRIFPIDRSRYDKRYRDAA